MRLRALFAALLCLVASAASPRGLVVTNYEPQTFFSGEDVFHRYWRQAKRQDQAIMNLLNDFGVSYKAVPLTAVTTNMLRTLLVYDKTRTPSVGSYNEQGPSEQFDWLIVLNGGATPPGYVSATNNDPPWPRDFNACAPCSLTVGGATSYPLKPTLFLFGAVLSSPWNGSNGASYIDRTAGSAPCTTGVSSYSQTTRPAMVRNMTTGGVWMSNANVGAFIPNATPPTGGFRGWLNCRTPHSEAYYRYNKINAVNADTFATFSNADSVVMWEMPFTGLYAGANNTLPIAPMVFANVMAGGPCADSAGRSVPCEYDGAIALMALARLDSLTNGKVFGTFVERKVAAIVVEGGFERGLRRLPGGAPNDDSTVVEASLGDSTTDNRIPITLTANMDSVASYPNELSWWRGRSNFRFAPTATRAVKDTTGLVSASWSKDRPVDVYGRYRNRAFFGDSLAFHAVEGSDSSIYQGLMLLRAKAVSYGLTPLSGALVAPLDDWTPKNMRGKATALDSLTRVMRLANYTCALTDVQRPEGSIFRIKTNPDLARGWDGNQYSYWNRLSAEPFRFVGHTGYNITGGAYNFLTYVDSTTIPLPWRIGISGPTGATVSQQMLSRFWSGFLHDQWRDLDWMQYDGVGGMGGYLDIKIPSADLFNDFRRASVLRLFVSDFGGDAGAPARPGWWAVKSLKRQFDSINATDGRILVLLGYPEDIEP